MAQINQSSLDGVPEVLLRFRDAVGVGRIGGPKIAQGRKPLYWWVASSRSDVTKTGARIGPWLCDAKRSRFRSATGVAFPDPPRRSVAWAAGLFDAEGSTSLGHHRSRAGYKCIEASITQAGVDIPQELRRFAECVGLGRINGPYDQEGAHASIYRWRVHTTNDVRRMLHVLLPRLGAVKRRQAIAAIALMDAQPTLPRGRTEWGSHKTHCVHGHEYGFARLRSYVARGVGLQHRPSKQCLVCAREQARARRHAAKNKIGGPSAADRSADGRDATC